jgi:hypothetical protein
MPKKLLKSVVALFSVLALVLPMYTKADGMVVTPPEYWMKENDQKAVVFYDKGVESLILSITFQGNANDFGWIVPTPTKPTINKGSDELFTNLQSLTNVSSGNVPMYDLGLSGSEKQTSGVSIVETKQIDYYDVTVLTATDKAALTTWLTDNKYNYPASSSYILDTYIQNNWYFVAMKIDSQSLDLNVSTQLRTGHATPVIMQFATENLVYPLKISTVINQGNTNVNTNTNSNTNTPVTIYDASNFTFVPGKFGKAAEFTSGKILAYAADSEFPYNNGTIEAQVNIKPWTSGGYRNIMSVGDANRSDTFQLRLGKSTSNGEETIQFIWYKSSGGFLAWRTTSSTPLTANTWHHVAVTWSSSQKPQIYLDGVAIATSAAYGETTWLGKQVSKGSFQVLGSRLGSGDYLNGDLDEYVVWDKVLTPTKILERSKAALQSNQTAVLKHEEGVVYYENFDDNITLENTEGVAYNQTNIPNLPSVLPSSYYSKSQNITLYVITNERKDATGFSTSYANWFSKKNIENLAFASTGAPLLTTSSKKMFVTVMTRTISSGQNLDDVFFRTATSQDTIGTAPDIINDASNLKFTIILGALGLLSIILVIILVLWNRRSAVPPPSPLSQ